MSPASSPRAELGRRPLILIGDSHAAIHARALRQVDLPVLACPLGSAPLFTKAFAEAGPDGLTLQGEIGARFARFAAANGLRDLADCQGRLVISLGLAGALFYASEDWKWVDFGPQADPGKRYLSAGVIDAMIAGMQAPVVSFIGHCAAAGLLVAAMMGPPPQKRHPAVQALGAERVLELAARCDGPVRDALAARGIPIINVRGVTDAEGLLLEAYWGKDDAHGSQGFSRRMLHELLRVTGRAASR